jgi:hypothetical protein
VDCYYDSKVLSSPGWCPDCSVDPNSPGLEVYLLMVEMV